jgi:hypothetical protein
VARISIGAAEDHPTTVRHYRPPDPEWADAVLLERVRQTLVQENADFNLWWNPNWKHDDLEHPGRWCFVQWLRHTKCWAVVFYFEGPTGEYRPIDPSSVTVLLHRVRACQDDARVLQDRIDNERAERLARQSMEIREALNEIASRGMKVLKGLTRPQLVDKIMAEFDARREQVLAELRVKHAEENREVAKKIINREMFAA